MQIKYFFGLGWEDDSDGRAGTWISQASSMSAARLLPLARKARNRPSKEDGMKKINLYEENGFSDSGMKNYLVHDSPYFKIINFNFKAGQELPVHSHDIEGQLSISVLEGQGEFLAADGQTMPAGTGDVLISDISEPHGIRAASDMRVLVTIAPPI